MIYDHMNSKPLFNWLRKIFKVDKPNSCPAKHYKEGDETWDEWDKRIKTAQPIGYFVTETLPDFIDDIRGLYKNPISDLSAYMSNRFRSQIHNLRTRLPIGKYYEVDTRILYGVFNTLVDFIECEKAWDHVSWNDDHRQEFSLKWYHRVRVVRWFFEWRNPEAGIAKLKWEMTLDKPDIDEYGNDMSSPLQAASAKEQYELYNWWKNVRPNRPDPWAIMTGFEQRMAEKYPEESHKLFSEYDEVDEIERSALYKQMDAIERQYDEEDEAMLIRLIKIRSHLWT